MSKIKWKLEQKSNPKDLAAAPSSKNHHSVKTVKVSNVSPGASEQDIKDFFSFSGDIEYVEMQSGNERSQIAYVTFSDSQGVETAFLLSGETIVDLAVHITPASEYELPPAASIPPAGKKLMLEQEGDDEDVDDDEEIDEGRIQTKKRRRTAQEGRIRTKKHLWNEQETLILLDIWKKKLMKRKKLRADEWSEVALSVSEILKTTLTEDQCFNRIHNLKSEYTKKLRLGEDWEYTKRKKGELLEDIEVVPPSLEEIEPSKRNIIVALKDQGVTAENLDGYLDNLSVEDQLKSLRDLVLTMAWRVKSSPLASPLLKDVSNDGFRWDSHAMIDLISRGHKNIRGVLECSGCGVVQNVEVDWREGYLNLSAYLLGYFYSTAEAEFEPPKGINTCMRCVDCSAKIRPVSSAAGYDWLFIALTLTVKGMPQQEVLDYLVAHKVKVSSETSQEKVILKFYISILTQLDPFNGWRLMRV